MQYPETGNKYLKDRHHLENAGQSCPCQAVLRACCGLVISCLLQKLLQASTDILSLLMLEKYLQEIFLRSTLF